MKLRPFPQTELWKVVSDGERGEREREREANCVGYGSVTIVTTAEIKPENSTWKAIISNIGLLKIAHTRVRSCATKSELLSSRMTSPTVVH